MDQPTIPPIPPAQPNPAASSPGLISPNKIYQPSRQNLINPITVLRQEPAEKAWKALIFDVLAVVGAGLFGYSFARYLAGGFSLWWVFGALLFWSAVSVIVGFIQKSTNRRFLVAFLEAIFLVACFYTIAWEALAVAIILVLFCLFWGYFSVRNALRNTVEIRFFAASGRVIGKVITASIIFMIIMYGSLGDSNGNLFVSQGVFNTFFNWTGELVNKFYPTIPVNGSFGDFAQAVAQIQLQNNPTFESLPPAQQNAAVADSAQQLMSGFTTSTSAAATPTSNVLYHYLANLFSNLQNRYNDLFLGGWALLLFLILRSIGIIVVWIGQFFALILYEILLASGFLKITEQSTTKETIAI